MSSRYKAFYLPKEQHRRHLPRNSPFWLKSFFFPFQGKIQRTDLECKRANQGRKFVRTFIHFSDFFKQPCGNPIWVSTFGYHSNRDDVTQQVVVSCIANLQVDGAVTILCVEREIVMAQLHWTSKLENYIKQDVHMIGTRPVSSASSQILWNAYPVVAPPKWIPSYSLLTWSPALKSAFCSNSCKQCFMEKNITGTGFSAALEFGTSTTE